MMDFNYKNGNEEEEILNQMFKIKIRKYDLAVENIIDNNGIYRLSSFSMSGNRYGRYYHRYGIFIIYKYDKDIRDTSYSLLDFKCYRFFEKEKLYQCYAYELYFRSVLLFFLPEFFMSIKMKYQVKFINSFPPFDEEDHQIINQDSGLEDDEDNIPLLPVEGYMVIRVAGTDFICKVDKRSKYFSGGSTRKNSEGMHMTSWVSPCSRLLAIPKIDFMNKCDEFFPLEFLLTEKVTKRRSIIFNQKEKNLNPFSRCEDIRVKVEPGIDS